MNESLKQNYNRYSKALFACVSYQELAVTIFCKHFILFSLILSHFILFCKRFILFSTMYNILIVWKVNCKLENGTYRLRYLRKTLFRNLPYTAHCFSYISMLKTDRTTVLHIFL